MNSSQTFFFYDLETSGLNPREDRIMQFAGQRTDLDLNPLGEPVNVLMKMSDDTLPSPNAVAVTKITPQKTLAEGLTEAELAKYLAEEIFTPNTIAVGFNTVRFDDEFMRNLFWRTFYDPYEWEWKDGRSRWDLLDVVRFTRALRPEGINWPVTEDGRATNRLELITKLNNISHDHAHDALSDVFATIAVAKLIKEKQPDLFQYFFNIRDKKSIQKLVNLDNKTPFVYASGRYSSDFNKTTVAFPLTASKNGNILVFDLRYNLEDLLKDTEKSTNNPTFYPVVKELCFNKCPAVAPLSVLEKFDGWAKLNLTKDQIKQNLQILLSHPEFAEATRSVYEKQKDWPTPVDPESALYDGFLNDQDRVRCNAVRNANANTLADFSPAFDDERLPNLLIHYKAKNFPNTLSEDESNLWQLYRQERLKRQIPNFLKELEELNSKDTFLAEELRLYFESLFDLE